MRHNEKSENIARGRRSLVVASQAVGVVAVYRPHRRPNPFVSGQSFHFQMTCALGIQNVVAHSRTKKSGHTRDPHARPFVFYLLAIPFRRRSELGGPGFPSQFACGDGPARTSVSANSKFVKILYELIGPNAVLFDFV